MQFDPTIPAYPTDGLHWGGNRDTTLNGVLYRQTEQGVFRIQNGQLIPLTASEKNMFLAMDGGTSKPTQNVLPVANTAQNKDQSSTNTTVIIGIVLVAVLLLSKRD